MLPKEDTDTPKHSPELSSNSLQGAFPKARDAKFLYADNRDSDQSAQADLCLLSAHLSDGMFLCIRIRYNFF